MLCQDRHCLGQDSNQTPLKYKSDELPLLGNDIETFIKLKIKHIFTSLSHVFDC
jgi:hypothetical protein